MGRPSLIARELLDRGEVQRIAVLCPPHLAEQWQREFSAKFNVDFELVLAGTARRLEQACAANQSLFDVYPHVIVSTDYIRRGTFSWSRPRLTAARTTPSARHPHGRGHPRHRPD